MEDANGSAVCTLFVLSIIILGSYFALQLVTGLLTAKYTVTSTKAAALARSTEMQTKATQLLQQETQKERRWFFFPKRDPQPTADPQTPSTGSKGSHTLNQSPPGVGTVAGSRANSPVWRCLASLQAFIINVVNNCWFERGVILLSIANAMLMGAEQREMTKLQFEILEYTNLFFCAAFSLEMVLLHAAHGARAYWEDPWTATDGVVSLLGTFEVVCTLLPVGAPEGINFTVLRLLRIVRVFRSAKVLRRVPGLLELLESIPQCFLALKDYSVLLLLFLVMFAVLGVHLFGEYDMGRRNFNSFPEALLTLFIMLTGSNWYLVLWSSMAAAPEVWPGMIFCITWMVLAYILLSTVFLAILIENVSLGGDAKSPKEDAEHQHGGLHQMLKEKAPPRSKNEGMNALISKQVTPEVQNEVLRIRQWLDLHEVRLPASARVHFNTMARVHVCALEAWY
ncbi:hypothetical protein CYMTET_39443 [Cymbomonas tetramitiformis]|uniref:Ion transport domain-containing protein n=1 Tax=Cymbomonas tetramitiformis TaxID=36881 RepID=A0AAE0F3X9_9CHLO|nr:hypothetical protein CYMTET_39443 [Cymbomonas tetramitiformis]